MQPFFMMTALDAKDGKTVWTAMHSDLFLPTSISLSETADAVFCGGANTNVFLAFSLMNGTILWKINSTSPIAASMQTKVGAPVFSQNQNDSSELVLLPTDPFDGNEGAGTLYALETASQGNLDWRSDLGFSSTGLFAFNSRGFLYGRMGGGGGPRRPTLFIVESSSGSPFYFGVGYCDGGAKFTSGPAVDPGGYVYYRYIIQMHKSKSELSSIPCVRIEHSQSACIDRPIFMHVHLQHRTEYTFSFSTVSPRLWCTYYLIRSAPCFYTVPTVYI